MNLSWIGNTILAVIVFILIFIKGSPTNFDDFVNMKNSNYPSVILFWVNAILASVVILNYSRLVYSRIEKTIVCKWITGIGKDAIVYVCFNKIVIRVFALLVKALPFALPLVVKLPVLFILDFGVLFVISKLIMNTKLKVLAGNF